MRGATCNTFSSKITLRLASQRLALPSFRVDRTAVERPSSVAFACFSGFASCFTNAARSVSYADWFSDPVVAETYTQAQHNGSVATAKYLIKKKLQLGDVSSMLDVGGGSGAFSYVFTKAIPGLKSLILELPEVCKTGEGFRAKQSEDVQERVKYIPLDATSPDWPVDGVLLTLS